MKLEAFTEAITQALGARLAALMLYGSAARNSETAARASMNTLLVVTGDAIDADVFAQLSGPVRSWVASGHPPPIIMTEREWLDASDAFPIEYDDIRAAHRVLAGNRDPWRGITVRAVDVRRQLEQELMGKLVHLRQAYAANWNRPKRLVDVIHETRAGFFTMLRAVLRLAGRTPPAEPDALVREAGGLIGFGADGLTEPAAYLDAMTRAAEFVNRMERTVS